MSPRTEYCDFIYPKRSSDYCVRAEQGDAGIYAVIDRIGSPLGLRLRWRNPMREMEQDIRNTFPTLPADGALDVLSEFLAERIAHHSVRIRSLRHRWDHEAFGYCLCLAAVSGRRARIHWLGDCRAYHLHRLPPAIPRGPACFDVRCLTRDHNAMGRLMDARDQIKLSPKEFAKLDHRLEYYLGYENVQEVQRVLREQRVEVDLGPDDALMLCTDGFYQPTQQVLLSSNALQLTAETFRLEQHLSRVLVQADQQIPAGPGYWPEMLTYLLDETLHAPGGRRQKDDIAFVGLYRTE